MLDEVHHVLILFLRLWRYTVGSAGWVRRVRSVRRVRRVRRVADYEGNLHASVQLLFVSSPHTHDLTCKCPIVFILPPHTHDLTCYTEQTQRKTY